MKKIYICLVLALLLSLVAPYSVKAGEGSTTIVREGLCPLTFFVPSTTEPGKYQMEAASASIYQTTSFLLIRSDDGSAKVVCTGEWNNPTFEWGVHQYYPSLLSGDSHPLVFNNSNTTDWLSEYYPGAITVFHDLYHSYLAYRITLIISPDGTFRFVAQGNRW